MAIPRVVPFLLALSLAVPLAAQAPPSKTPSKPDAISSGDRDRAEQMLSQIHDALHDHYYDLTFHGVDMDKRYNLYAEKMRTVPTLGAAYIVIAAYLSGLHDSHTYFVPPARSYNFDYGLRLQMIGDRCFVTNLRPDSDAAAQLHPGDEIVSLNGYSVNRKDFHDLSYSLYSLSPVPELRLSVSDPQEVARAVAVRTHYLPGVKLGSLIDLMNGPMQEEAEMHLQRERSLDAGDVFVWRIPSFDGDESEMNKFLGQARKHPAIVLDLRGNPGGVVDMVRALLGNFLGQDVKIADLVGRKKQKPMMPSSQGKLYDGKIIVLVDSGSASGAEIVARALQLAHRATVVGDQSAGAVMEARIYPMQVGVDPYTFYAAAITQDTLLMADGHSLEGVGVTPDVLALPTAVDLAASRDPVLSEAVKLAGGNLDPVAAGQAFPYEWMPLNISH